MRMVHRFRDSALGDHERIEKCARHGRTIYRKERGYWYCVSCRKQANREGANAYLPDREFTRKRRAAEAILESRDDYYDDL